MKFEFEKISKKAVEINQQQNRLRKELELRSQNRDPEKERLEEERLLREEVFGGSYTEAEKRMQETKRSFEKLQERGQTNERLLKKIKMWEEEETRKIVEANKKIFVDSGVVDLLDKIIENQLLVISTGDTYKPAKIEWDNNANLIRFLFDQDNSGTSDLNGYGESVGGGRNYCNTILFEIIDNKKVGLKYSVGEEYKFLTEKEEIENAIIDVIAKHENSNYVTRFSW